MTKERVCATEQDVPFGLGMGPRHPNDPIYQIGYERCLDTLLASILDLSKIGVATIDSKMRVELNQGAHGALYEAIGRLAWEAMKIHDDTIA